jgi:hypothetical protein
MLLSVAVAIGASACVAGAASFGLTTTASGAGDTPVPHCDPDGFTYVYTTSRGNVTAVTVGGIADPACEGGSLSLTLTNSLGDGVASGGPQVVPSDGDAADNSLTVATSPQPLASLVTGIHVYIAGP